MNKLKQNRVASFIVVTLVYIIATVVGVLAYRTLMLDWRWSLLLRARGIWRQVGAVANTLLFLVVSIPMADKRQSRKEGFAEYKKQTKMLLPIKK